MVAVDVILFRRSSRLFPVSSSMMRALIISSSFSGALLFLIWLVSLDALINQVSVAAVIIARSSSSSPLRAVSAVLIPLLISFHGFKTRKFTFAATILCFISGVLLLSSGLQYFCCVLAFYVAKSALILYIWRRKLYLGGSNHPYPPLTCCRVIVKGLGPALISTCKLVLTHYNSTNSNCINCRIADVVFIAYVACCAGLGFSTELAAVRTAKPKLITTWRNVMPGVRGGVTLMSTIASAFGGGLIGMVFCAVVSLSPVLEPPIMGVNVFSCQCQIMLGMLAGMLGTCFGSLLGALLIYSGHDPVTNKVVSHANGGLIEHVTGIDLLNDSQVACLASSLTGASFAAVAWFKFSYSFN